MKEKLELRMYGIVPYNISPIQQAIQFGHAVVEYGQNVKSYDLINNIELKKYNDWADSWKTFIILNGGTSNHSINRYHQTDEPFVGTMESNLITLEQNNVEIATFYEPDLNDMLSAVVFIVDERVFNKKDYPDFEDWVIENYGDLLKSNSSNYKSSYQAAKSMKLSNSVEDQEVYQIWVEFVGGEKNVFLRDFLKNFRLA
jgi:hypothetical protein